MHCGNVEHAGEPVGNLLFHPGTDQRFPAFP
nr:MAG TPA: hypothetical protein [Caudoviricetes sp.]